MRTVHFALLASCALFLMSCAFEKQNEEVSYDDSSGIENLEESPEDRDPGRASEDESLDSDCDLIPDLVEKEHNLDPYIGDNPRLLISSAKYVEAGGRLAKRENGVSKEFDHILAHNQSGSSAIIISNEYVRRRIVDLHYKRLLDPPWLPSVQHFPTKTDFDLYLLGAWPARLRFPFKALFSQERDRFEHVSQSGKIKTIFNIAFTNIKHVKSVEKVVISTNLVNLRNDTILEFKAHPLLNEERRQEVFNFNGEINSFSALGDYSILDYDLLPESVFSALVEDAEVSLRVKNFRFSRFGKKIDYATLKANAAKKCARFIVSKGSLGSDTVEYIVAPGITPIQLLERLGSLASVDNEGKLLSLGDIESNLPSSTNIRNPQEGEMGLGTWEVFGNSQSLNDPLQPGGQYILSYVTLRDLLLTQGRKKQIADQSTVTTEFPVDDLRVGDKLEFHITGYRESPKLVEYEHSYASCLFRHGQFEDRCDDMSDMCDRIEHVWEESGACVTIRKKHDGHNNKAPLLFNYLIGKFKLSIGGDTLPLRSILLDDQLSVHSGGEKLSFELRLHEGWLKNGDSIELIFLPTVSPDVFTVGHVRYASPKPWGNAHGFLEVLSYPRDTSNIRLNYKDSLLVDVFRTGINR